MTETHSAPKTGNISTTPSTPDPSTERGALYVELSRLTNEVTELRNAIERRDFWLRSLYSCMVESQSAHAKTTSHAYLADYERGVQTGHKIASDWLDMIAANCHIEPWG